MGITLIVRDADDPRYKPWKDAGHDVVGQLVSHRTPQGLAKDGLAICHRDYEGTQRGPCVIVGMGVSRKRLKADLGMIPVYAMNRAALERKPDIWCAHDMEAVLDCHESVPLGVPLATYSNNWIKPGFERVLASGRKLIAWDIFPEPSRHGRRPLYWNVTTLGPLLDWVIRMGHSPVYTIGTDCKTGGYANPHYTPEELAVSHEFVRLKMCFMFGKEEIGKWNPSGVPVRDLSGEGSAAPWQAATPEEIAFYTDAGK